MTHSSNGGSADESSAVRRFLSARLDRASDMGLHQTITVLVLALAVWAFSGLLDLVLDNGALVRWDVAVNAWFHAHATPTGLRVFDIITQIGTVGVAVTIAIVAVWLWRRKELHVLQAWLTTNLGGLLLLQVLKHSVHRSRPQYAAPFLHGHSYSFPSGHTMASAVCYLSLAYVLSLVNRWSRAKRLAAEAVALFLVLLVAFSRVYLGVHYPSDVLGGIAAAVAWLAANRAVLNFLSHRRARASA